MRKTLLTVVIFSLFLATALCGGSEGWCNFGDTTPPVYLNDSDNSSGRVVSGTSVKITTTWVDYRNNDFKGEVSQAMLEIYKNKSGEITPLKNYTCYIEKQRGTCEYIFTARLPEDANESVTVCWKQIAKDSCGNTNSTMPLHCFQVVPVPQENNTVETNEGNASSVTAPEANETANETTPTTETTNKTQPTEATTPTENQTSEGETTEKPPSYTESTVNHPPSTPGLVFPCDVSIPAGNITFIWMASTDEDPGDEENISYSLFLITSGRAGPNITSFELVNPNKWHNTINYTIPILSTKNYTWGVKAYDGKAFSNGMELCNFSVSPGRETTNLTEGKETEEPAVGVRKANISIPNASITPWNQTSERIIQVISTGIPETWVAGIGVGILVLMMLLFLYSHFYARKAGEETAKKLLRKKETETRKKWIASLKARKRELNKKLAKLAKKEVAGLTSDEIAARKAYKQELIQIQEALLNTDEYLRELDERANKAIHEAKAGIPSKTIMKELKEEGYTKKEIEIIKKLFQKKIKKESP